MSKIRFPLVLFMQRSESDLQVELNLLRQAKKYVAKLLSRYVEAVHFNRQEDVLALEDAYAKIVKTLFSESSEIPPIRVSCGLDPVPVVEPVQGELLEHLPGSVPVDEWVEKHQVKPAIVGELTGEFKELSTNPLGETSQDEPLTPIVWMSQREIDGVQFLGRSEALDILEKAIQEASDE